MYDLQGFPLQTSDSQRSEVLGYVSFKPSPPIGRYFCFVLKESPGTVSVGSRLFHPTAYHYQVSTAATGSSRVFKDRFLLLVYLFRISNHSLLFAIRKGDCYYQ